ncbi:hybrid-cluster NAD(P)-dependent oxidoreductase [Pragia fontium]|uniref:Hybrid-cluster NAD(P)-dependent oxidoreductase n=1 Tax=Pragia fontium TaxID=82985 RepID=A0ABQ5LFX1_9GAMM|nr:NADH oxidoreductase [Pragia fontium]GKX62505.1 hybrid-cluster NAD(P)-dependent oxidoreductase [Pragia fontium]
MTMPTSLCPNPMQIHSIQQETADVWTLELIAQDFYPYLPGQYALVSIRHSDTTLRAYTLSSSPGLSRFITLTVRCLPGGEGSTWLTREVKVGNTLWLSDAQGEFTCSHIADSHYLMLAGGCGVTPIMSMSRWILANQPTCDLVVFYNVRSPADVIFAQEWQQLAERYPSQFTLYLMAEHDVATGYLSGRISKELLQQKVSDISQRTVMTCGPAVYMSEVEKISLALGVPASRFHKEQFHTAAECISDSDPLVNLTIHRLNKHFTAPIGTTLLYALEQHQVPVIAACRAGVCGSCKTQIAKGDYTTTSQMTLTDNEIAQGYVLACSCQLTGDVELV